MQLTQKAAITLINGYQKYISPYKGFKCAHAAYYQGDSRSVAIQNIITETGVIDGYPLIRKRFAECRAAYVQLQSEHHSKQDKRKTKKGKEKENKCDSCDPCGAAELTSCLPKRSCDLPDFPCDCSPF